MSVSAGRFQLATLGVLIVAALTWLAPPADAATNVTTIAEARTHIASNGAPDARFFSQESLDRLGVKVKSVSINDASAVSATVMYEPFDGTDYSGQLWIERAPRSDPASSFDSPSCSDRPVNGPIALGAYVAWEVDCDINMVYRFFADGYLYTVGSKYYGGLTVSSLGEALAGLTQVEAPSPATTDLPKLLKSSWSSGFVVRPKRVLLASTAIVSGRGAKPSIKRRIRWSKWKSTSASARVRIWFDDCRPNCAKGTYHPYKASIKAFRPLDGRYTRLKISYPGKTPRRASFRGTLKLKQSGEYNYWG